MSATKTMAPARRQKLWTPNQARLVKQTLLKPKNREATDDELLLFAYQCERTGLDPFTRQIYGIYRYDKRLGREALQVQVAIDGLRLIAERTKNYLGQTPQEWCGPDGAWRDIWTEAKAPFAARAGVYKRGRDVATLAVAKFSFYAQTYDGKLSGLWAQMPDHMISKCAEALALRKAFPAETSGLYIPEEMDRAEPDTPDVIEAAVAEMPAARESTSPQAPDLNAQIERLCSALDYMPGKTRALLAGANTLKAKRALISRLESDLDTRNA